MGSRPTRELTGPSSITGNFWWENLPSTTLNKNSWKFPLAPLIRLGAVSFYEKMTILHSTINMTFNS
jgi:hypothetical protein